MNPKSSLKQSAMLARSTRVEQQVHSRSGILPDSHKSPHVIASSFDADLGLDVIELSDGTTKYATSLTNGVRGVGDELLLHSASGITAVDTKPHSRRRPIKKIPPRILTTSYLGFLKVGEEYTFKLQFVDISKQQIKGKTTIYESGFSPVVNGYNAIVYENQKVYYFWIDTLNFLEPGSNLADSGNLRGNCLIVDIVTKTHTIEQWVLKINNVSQLRNIRFVYDYNGYFVVPIYYLSLKTFIVKYLTNSGQLRFAAFSGTSDNYANLGGILGWDLGTLNESRTNRENPAFFFDDGRIHGNFNYYGLPFYNAYGVVGGVILQHGGGTSFISETLISGEDVNIYTTLPPEVPDLQRMDTRNQYFPNNLRPTSQFLFPLGLKQDKNQVNYDYEIKP